MRILLLLSLLFVAACDAGPRGSKPQFTDLQIHSTVPSFNFLERAGKPVDNATLLGKVWVASFIFTSCPTHCVAMCRQMSRLQDAFIDDADFRIVATTVDPARDTVEVLRDFAKKYRAKEDRWLFLTGGRDAIVRFSGADGLKVGGHPDEPLHHSTTFTLVDKKGVIRGYYKLGGEGRMQKLRTDIRALLDEK